MEDTARTKRAPRGRTSTSRNAATLEQDAAGQAAAKRARAPKTTKAADTAEPRPYHHGNLREVLVRCGKQQLSEVGLAELSLRRIASSVGVSQVAPKHHFGNKEGLLAAIAASGFRDLTEFRFARLRPSMSAEQRLRSLLSNYVAFATLHPTLFHLMFSPQFRSTQVHAELDDAASQCYHTLVRAASDYLAAQGKADEANAFSIARVAWMCMHGVATLTVDYRINPLGAPKVTSEQLASQTLDVIFAGIRGLNGIQP
ncbi:TetR/AcrR family transcriptional regulator [Paraburkholderia sp. LEh10]|uniref:TetR/AcrR family transcriptional regulator n=1 Tax=Paraburkholderia sp. LEh10 TaxID=2821353 RepID=UPI001AE26D35|nr:TetR/AcrR family transcriptional regulator [Paraburkholderia sp. LEh10]MBP0588393.1 TetR/AcrR family transcriptional regulator [Paraburkholderia sp. LEh10]